MARRIRLREYHESVLARLQNLGAGSARQAGSRLGVRTAGENWLLDLGAIAEVLALPPIVPVPLTHPWFAGVTNVRGNLHGVVDFSMFIRGKPTPTGPDCRVVLLHPRFGVNCGLMVQHVVGLRNVAELQAGEPRQDDEPGWLGARYADETGAGWRELEVAALAAEPRFLNIALFQRRNVFTNVLEGVSPTSGN